MWLPFMTEYNKIVFGIDRDKQLEEKGNNTDVRSIKKVEAKKIVKKNREIKFRCWWDNRMHYVEEINFKRKKVNLLGADTISIEECILMQYTGLKDKNGKEIYEGDILIAPCWIDEDIKCVCIYAQQNSTSEIIGYGLYSFDNYFKDYRNLIFSDEWDEFEVVGNIYENKELLEKGE